MRADGPRWVGKAAIGGLSLSLVIAVVSPPWAGSTRDSVFGCLAGHDTAYAEGYTESGFCSLELGMTREEVVRILGRPLDYEESLRRREWSYTKSPSSTSYHVRGVVFDAAGTLVAKRAELWLD